MARHELLFKRDHRYSLWRRTLSNQWYASDIDTTMWCVYGSECKVIALLEEKKSTITELDLNSCQFQALRDLAGSKPLFVLLSHHNEQHNYQSFYIVAANKAARRMLKKAVGVDRRYLSEQDYVRFEAYLRKEKPSLMYIDKTCILLDKFPLPEIKDMND